jgi:uncharacterized membrane protein YhiD involved in acid resistance
MVSTAQIVVRLILSVVFGLIISLFVKKEKGLNFRIFPLFSLLACFVIIFLLEVFLKVFSKIEITLLPAVIVLGLFLITKPLLKKTENEEELIESISYLILTVLVGFCLGFGFYEIAIFATVLILILATFFPHLEKLSDKKISFRRKNLK